MIKHHSHIRTLFGDHNRLMIRNKAFGSPPLIFVWASLGPARLLRLPFSESAVQSDRPVARGPIKLDELSKVEGFPLTVAATLRNAT